MGATFSQVKTVATGGTILAADWNAEFQNILTNLTPAGIDDESATLAAKKVTANPASTLATSLQGELQQIRYILQLLGRSEWWYSTPVSGQIGTFTRAMDAATGDETETLSFGFTPQIFVFLSSLDAKPGISVGFDNGTNHYSVYQAYGGTNWYASGTHSIVITEDNGKSQSGLVKTISATELVITWTRTGATASGTGNVFYLAI